MKRASRLERADLLEILALEPESDLWVCGRLPRPGCAFELGGGAGGGGELGDVGGGEHGGAVDVGLDEGVGGEDGGAGEGEGVGVGHCGGGYGDGNGHVEGPDTITARTARTAARPSTPHFSLEKAGTNWVTEHRAAKLDIGATPKNRGREGNGVDWQLIAECRLRRNVSVLDYYVLEYIQSQFGASSHGASSHTD
ncbi:hypothetical protein V501_06552 [Pseudogymnoascus sp. VKM F-4519 (FW-2642)]|nr:hypothetical protein V501_06552 [Pseudogymnoascus sp. VKM F-4519 (FW-2642)]